MKKVFFENAKSIKKEIILAPLFSIIVIILQMSITYFMTILIDQGVEVGNINVVYQVGIVLVILSAISLFCGYQAGKYASKAASGLATNLRSSMFEKIQTFSFKNIDHFSSASLVTRITTDVGFVQRAFQMTIRIAVRAPILLVVATTMVVLINAQIALVFLAITPILVIGLILIIKYANPYFEAAFREYDVLNRVVQENLQGIRTVKSYVREDFETTKFKKNSLVIYNLFAKAGKIVAFNSPLMNFSIFASRILICWIAAKLIVGGSMSVGQLNSVMTYMMQILMSLMMLSMVLVMIIISKAAAERIVEVLETEVDLVNPENPLQEVKDGSIIFDNVSFSYDNKNKRFALRNISLNINSGEVVGIIGGTGSSKTSLVHLIPRLYDATSGSVQVGGHDVTEYDLHTLRDNVAMVLQKNTLFTGSLRENLCWGKEDATDEEIIKASTIAQAHEFISELEEGYNTHVEQGGTNFSGGQKQRICIARALLKQPKVLILDDSTSAVDTKTDALIQKGLKEYLPETTKIIIAQRISSVEHADKILVLDNGEISAIGTHQELIKTSSIYNEVYTSQQKGAEENES